MEIVVIWFRRDMRLDDHIALSKAITYAKKHQYRLFAFYHLDPFFYRNGTGFEQRTFLSKLGQFRQGSERISHVCSSHS
nr:deoxyribodipyrimidine photo-lyase [Bacillus altitudinis]